MNVIKKVMFRIMMNSIAKKNMLSAPKLVHLSAKSFIGYSITTTIRNNKQKEDIPPFYHSIYDNNKLHKLISEEEFKMYCIFDMHQNQKDFDYYVTVENTAQLTDAEYAKIQIPSGEYIQVEFLKRNNKVVNMGMMYLRKVWIKANGFQERNALPFIVYDQRFHGNYQKYGCKGNYYLGTPVATLYIPVNKRNR